MTIGLLIIGDELLSGKRSDRHLPKVIELLGARGMSLDWAQFLGDEEAQIAESIDLARRRGDVVLSCGGIGATPDDRTRQAAARAFGLPLAVQPEAAALIEAEYGARANPLRLLLAQFPEGAAIIPNPVNRVAGFFVGACYFVPGFPEMAWPMLEWVLDTQLVRLHCAAPAVEFRLLAFGSGGEGDLIPLMEATLVRFPGVKLSSLPSRSSETAPRHIEFGIKGERVLASAAFAWFSEQLIVRGDIRIESLPSR